jgi:predicted kinase
MKIIVPIGISGSGKSKLYKDEYSNMTIISPDLIRYELTNDISNQSKNKEVFEIVNQRVEDCVKNNVDFFYDATNVNTKYRKSFVDKFKGNKDVEITYVVLPADVKVSYERIRNDIKNNVNRSDVPYDVIQIQYGLYKESLKHKFENENVHTVLYM